MLTGLLEDDSGKCYKATAKKIYTLHGATDLADVYVRMQRAVRVRLADDGLYQDAGYFNGVSFDDNNFVTDFSSKVADATKMKPVGCGTDGLYSLGCSLLLKPVNSCDGSELIVKKLSDDIVTGASYTAPSASGELGKVSITYKSGAAFAAFVTTEAPTDKEQVLIYTAVADAQAADTYQNA